MVNVLVLDIETSGLFASSNHISCVGVFSPSFGIRVFAGEEKALLSEFLEFMEEETSDCELLVTYNGRVFDLPFVIKRCQVLGVDVAPALWPDDLHVDLMDVAKQRIAFGKRLVSRDEACRKMDIYSPKCVSGFYCAVLAGEGDSPELFKVFQHNALDLTSTYELYLKFKRFGWL